MLTKIEKLKKQMELQVDADIFGMDLFSLFDHYGISGARDYSGLRLCCFDNEYIINKNVFDTYNNEKIKDVMRMLHNTWCCNNVNITKNKIKNKIKSGICFDLCNDVDVKYAYYLKLKHLYKNILDNITKCKTLPNKQIKRNVRFI